MPPRKKSTTGKTPAKTPAKKAPPERQTLGDQLRAAIAASGMTMNKIAVDAGLSAAVVGHFMHGERDIRLKAADQIASVLGLCFAPIDAGGTNRQAGGAS